MKLAKSEEQIAIMREGGQKLGRILQQLLATAQPDVRLNNIDELATELIEKAGGTPSFKTVKGYTWATCLCVNDVVVHGVPSDTRLDEGDILTIDVGMLYKGLHTDTAWTKIVTGDKGQETRDRRQGTGDKGQEIREREVFLKTGEVALGRAIAQATVGNSVGHISQAIQNTIETAGYSIVKTLVGHGIGKKLHEAPQIPGFLRGEIVRTPIILVGMTLAIEVIYAQGSGAVTYEGNDGWAIATRDTSISSVFEHSVAVTKNGPLILTTRTN